MHAFPHTTAHHESFIDSTVPKPELRGLSALALALLISLGTGCGTLTRNDVKNEYPMIPHSKVYPATLFDLWMAYSPAAPLAIIDFPISIATDTLLLPYDLWTSRSSRSGNYKPTETRAQWYKRTIATEINQRRVEANQWLSDQISLPSEATRDHIGPRLGELLPALEFLQRSSTRGYKVPPYGWLGHRRFAGYRPGVRLGLSAQGFVEKLQKLGAHQIYAAKFGTPTSDAFLIGMPETGTKKLQELLDFETSHHDLDSARTDDGRWVLIWWGLQHRKQPK
jgi:uncharacterized protein YceK